MNTFGDALEKAYDGQAAQTDNRGLIQHNAFSFSAREQRYHNRRTCFIEGRGLISLGHVDVWSCQGVVMNYSLGGILFKLTSPLIDATILKANENATHMELRLALDGQGSGEIKVSGKVMHFESGRTVFLGVQFDSPMPELVEKFSA